MAESTQCLACDTVLGAQVAPGGIIYQSEHWLVDHHFGAIMKGFLIIKSRRHCEHVAQLTPDELTDFGRVVGLTSKALTEVMSPAKVYVCSWGESATHVHWCLIPRSDDMPANGIEVTTNLWDGRWSCTAEEAAEVADQVRDLMR
ncbi:MAG TPA: HIT family protein [Dehalococcoidia bacterium]|nr:HIT family protein [Dehalococcoidia bacterium]